MAHKVDIITATTTAEALGEAVQQSIDIAEGQGLELVDVKFQCAAVSDDARDGLYYAALIVYTLPTLELEPADQGK